MFWGRMRISEVRGEVNRGLIVATSVGEEGVLACTYSYKRYLGRCSCYVSVFITRRELIPGS